MIVNEDFYLYGMNYPIVKQYVITIFCDYMYRKNESI